MYSWFGRIVKKNFLGSVSKFEENHAQGQSKINNDFLKDVYQIVSNWRNGNGRKRWGREKKERRERKIREERQNTETETERAET